jgi:hypothetical protein
MSRRARPSRPVVLLGVLAVAVAGALLLERARPRRPTDTPVLAVAAADVVAVRVQEGGRELRAVRDPNGWRADVPSPARPGSSEAIGDLVNAIVAMVALDAFTRSDLDRRALGLEPPRARIEITLASRSEPIGLALGDYTPSGGSVYGAVDGDRRIFRIGALIANEVENALHRMWPREAGRSSE